MFTTCPECGTVFRIGPAQLRAAEGFVRCGTCAATFNALLSLTDELPAGAGGTASAAPATAAAGAIPPIVARTIEPGGSAPALAAAATTGADQATAPAGLAAAASAPAAVPVPPPVPRVAPAAVAPPQPPAPPGELPDDGVELEIPHEFGPESWDDTLDVPQPAPRFGGAVPAATSQDDPARHSRDAAGVSGPADEPPSIGSGEDEDPAPAVHRGEAADDEPFTGPDEGDDGDTLAGVVEHADWESLLTGLDDDDEEGSEPVYVVEEDSGPAAPPSVRLAAAPAGTAPSLAVMPAVAPHPRPPLEPAATGGFAGARHPEDDSLPSADAEADEVPPLGALDDLVDDDLAEEPRLPGLGDPDDDESFPALDEPDRGAEEPLPASVEPDDDGHPTEAPEPTPLTAAAVAAATAAAARTATTPDAWADRPAWPPEPEPAPRGRWLYGAGSLLLALALAAQVVTHQRDELATHPEWGPLVRSLYAGLGMDVYPAWDLSGYEVRGSEAVAGRSTPGALDIVARLAVVGTRPTGLPLVRVTLRDRRGDVLAQRVVAPAEYLPPDAALAEPVRPGTLIPVEVSLVDPGVDASGYEVDVCLMTRAQGLVCQAEREPFQR